MPELVSRFGKACSWWLTLPLLVLSVHPAFSQAPDCLSCHADKSLTATDASGKSKSVHVEPAAFQQSVHGVLSCSDCHADVKGYPHDPPPAKVDCGQCHADAVAGHKNSVHGAAVARGSDKAATCAGCHGDVHTLVPSSDPKSRTHRANIPATCSSCHGVKFVMELSGISAQPVFSYRESVHGKAVAAGSEKAAVCTDCHGVHEILRASDSKSSIFKFSVPNTCGKCHQAVATEFKGSIHGKVLARGNWQAPACTDCHGIHAIKSHIDPASPVGAQALARTTCGKCHEGVRLSQEFGTAAGRVTTYLDSYHGMASRFGSKVVANCASCHGVHDILPSSDPASKVHKSNLAQTCGVCHPGASENFAVGAVHIDVRKASEDTGTIVIGWIRRFYLVLIFTVVGGMLVHNLIIWRRKALDRRRAIPRPVIRMSLNQRVQHFLLLVSFFALVLTGFALTYPESWVAKLLGSSETVRRIGHRVAAVVLLAVSIYHLIYVSATKEGREAFRAFWPTRKDMADFLQTMRYYLGLSSDRPHYGRFSYPEKVEYWALIWGTIIMAVTGLAAWFQVQVVGVLPRWSIDVALAIHFYEAVLATLAIVVWHFYQVIFDPDVYPLNWAFWDGRISSEHAGHPATLEQGSTPPEARAGTAVAADELDQSEGNQEP